LDKSRGKRQGRPELSAPPAVIGAGREATSAHPQVPKTLEGGAGRHNVSRDRAQFMHEALPRGRGCARGAGAVTLVSRTASEGKE